MLLSPLVGMRCSEPAKALSIQTGQDMLQHGRLYTSGIQDILWQAYHRNNVKPPVELAYPLRLGWFPIKKQYLTLLEHHSFMVMKTLVSLAFVTLELCLCREADALATNADISRRRAERRAQKLGKDLAGLQALLKQRDR